MSPTRGPITCLHQGTLFAPSRKKPGQRGAGKRPSEDGPSNHGPSNRVPVSPRCSHFADAAQGLVPSGPLETTTSPKVNFGPPPAGGVGQW